MATYTGISFGGYHSYDDWGLRLKKIEIEIPEAKTKYISINGADGEIDLTEIRNDGVKHGMRTLRFTFDLRNCSYVRWAGVISQIAYVVEGKKIDIILDDDSDYYYTGRGHLSTTKENDVTAEIVIECYCQPMKTDGSTELI